MIIRTERSGNYTITPNIIYDIEMSLEAKGMLGYLLTLPQDWKVNDKHLTKKMNIGRNKYLRIMREIKDAGYAKTQATLDDNGAFSGSELLICDDGRYLAESTVSGLSGNGTVPEPDDILSTNNNQELKDTNVKATTVADTDPFFDFLWDNWTDNPKRRGSKKRALTVWRRLSKADQEKAAKLSQKYIERCRQDKQFVKHVSAWLNQDGWLDEEEILEAAE